MDQRLENFLREHYVRRDGDVRAVYARSKDKTKVRFPGNHWVRIDGVEVQELRGQELMTKVTSL